MWNTGFCYIGDNIIEGKKRLRDFLFALFAMVLSTSSGAQILDKSAATHTLYLGAGSKHYTYGVGYNKCWYLTAAPVSFSFDISYFSEKEYLRKTRGIPLSIAFAYGKSIRVGLEGTFSWIGEASRIVKAPSVGYYPWDGGGGVLFGAPFIKYQRRKGGLYAKVDVIPFFNQNCTYIPDEVEPFRKFCPSQGRSAIHSTNLYPGIEVGYTLPRFKRSRLK